MLTTVELRWFYPGKLPAQIADWFKQDPLGVSLEPPEEREDLYLYSPDSDNIGIKLRQGRLEIKWRKAGLEIAHFGNKVEGKLEKWGKWLCEDSTGESFAVADVQGKKAWVSVKKKRQERKYQVSSNQSVIPVPKSESIDQGCNFELTELNINGNDWWSIAFEAFGKEDDITENLQAVASWVFNTYDGQNLHTEDSYAYPSWLLRCFLDV